MDTKELNYCLKDTKPMNFANSIFDIKDNQAQEDARQTNGSVGTIIPRLWLRPKELNSEISSSPLFRLFMGKRSSDSAKISLRAFEVYKNMLIFRKDTFDSKIKGILPLERLRISFEPLECEDANIPASIFAFKLTAVRDGRFTAMYVRTREDMEMLKQALWGQVINTNLYEDFRINEKIGSGGFGKVFRMTRISDERKFAGKAFSKAQLLSKLRGKSSLFNEISLMRSLDSKNFVKIEAVYETERSVYLIMELLEGGEIFSRFPQNRLSSQETKHLVRSLIQAVCELQARNIIHRDIKPSNIMLKYSNRELADSELKLIDFGLSTLADSSGHNLFSICGTPGFIAPEIARLTKESMDTITPAYLSNCDVFSVGTIMFYLLTGEIPFQGDSFQEVLSSNKKGTINWD